MSHRGPSGVRPRWTTGGGSGAAARRTSASVSPHPRPASAGAASVAAAPSVAVQAQPAWSRSPSASSIDAQAFGQMKDQYIRLSRELVDSSSRAERLQRALADTRKEAARVARREQIAALHLEQMKAQLQRAQADAEASSSALRKLEARLSSSAEGQSALSRAHAQALQRSHSALQAQRQADATRIEEMGALVQELNGKVALLQSALHVRAGELVRAARPHRDRDQGGGRNEHDSLHSSSHPSRRHPPAPAPAQAPPFDPAGGDSEHEHDAAPRPRFRAPPQPHNGGVSPAHTPAKSVAEAAAAAAAAAETSFVRSPSFVTDSSVHAHDMSEDGATTPPTPPRARVPRQYQPPPQAQQPQQPPQLQAPAQPREDHSTPSSPSRVESVAVAALLVRVAQLESALGSSTATPSPQARLSPEHVDLAEQLALSRAECAELRRTHDDHLAILALRESELSSLRAAHADQTRVRGALEKNASQLYALNGAQRVELAKLKAEQKHVLDYVEELLCRLKTLSAERGAARSTRIALQNQLDQSAEINRALMREQAEWSAAQTRAAADREQKQRAERRLQSLARELREAETALQQRDAAAHQQAAEAARQATAAEQHRAAQAELAALVARQQAALERSTSEAQARRQQLEVESARQEELQRAWAQASRAERERDEQLRLLERQLQEFMDRQQQQPQQQQQPEQDRVAPRASSSQAQPDALPQPPLDNASEWFQASEAERSFATPSRPPATQATDSGASIPSSPRQAPSPSSFALRLAASVPLPPSTSSTPRSRASARNAPQLQAHASPSQPFQPASASSHPPARAPQSLSAPPLVTGSGSGPVSHPHPHPHPHPPLAPVPVELTRTMQLPELPPPLPPLEITMDESITADRELEAQREEKDEREETSAGHRPSQSVLSRTSSPPGIFVSSQREGGGGGGGGGGGSPHPRRLVDLLGDEEFFILAPTTMPCASDSHSHRSRSVSPEAGARSRDHRTERARSSPSSPPRRRSRSASPAVDVRQRRRSRTPTARTRSRSPRRRPTQSPPSGSRAARDRRHSRCEDHSPPSPDRWMSASASAPSSTRSHGRPAADPFTPRVQDAESPSRVRGRTRAASQRVPSHSNPPARSSSDDGVHADEQERASRRPKQRDQQTHHSAPTRHSPSPPPHQRPVDASPPRRAHGPRATMAVGGPGTDAWLQASPARTAIRDVDAAVQITHASAHYAPAPHSTSLDNEARTAQQQQQQQWSQLDMVPSRASQSASAGSDTPSSDWRHRAHARAQTHSPPLSSHASPDHSHAYPPHGSSLTLSDVVSSGIGVVVGGGGSLYHSSFSISSPTVMSTLDSSGSRQDDPSVPSSWSEEEKYRHNAQAHERMSYALHTPPRLPHQRSIRIASLASQSERAHSSAISTSTTTSTDTSTRAPRHDPYASCSSSSSSSSSPPSQFTRSTRTRSASSSPPSLRSPISRREHRRDEARPPGRSRQQRGETKLQRYDPHEARTDVERPGDSSSASLTSLSEDRTASSSQHSSAASLQAPPQAPEEERGRRATARVDDTLCTPGESSRSLSTLDRQHASPPSALSRAASPSPSPSSSSSSSSRSRSVASVHVRFSPLDSFRSHSPLPPDSQEQSGEEEEGEEEERAQSPSQSRELSASPSRWDRDYLRASTSSLHDADASGGGAIELTLSPSALSSSSSLTESRHETYDNDRSFRPPPPPLLEDESNFSPHADTYGDASLTPTDSSPSDSSRSSDDGERRRMRRDRSASPLSSASSSPNRRDRSAGRSHSAEARGVAKRRHASRHDVRGRGAVRDLSSELSSVDDSQQSHWGRREQSGACSPTADSPLPSRLGESDFSTPADAAVAGTHADSRRDHTLSSSVGRDSSASSLVRAAARRWRAASPPHAGVASFSSTSSLSASPLPAHLAGRWSAGARFGSRMTAAPTANQWTTRASSSFDPLPRQRDSSPPPSATAPASHGVIPGGSARLLPRPAVGMDVRSSRTDPAHDSPLAVAVTTQSPRNRVSFSFSKGVAALLTFGTYKLTGSQCTDSVLSALRHGFHRVDTGASYGNEEAVGRALAASCLPRSAVFVGTKLSWADLTTSDHADTAGHACLKRLGLAYVDQMLLHHPGRAKLPKDSPLHASSCLAAWRGLERLQAEGQVRRIGVSNFEQKHLAQLLGQTAGGAASSSSSAAGHGAARVRPAVNQIEMHPLLFDTQRALSSFCAAHSITVEAYMPLGGGKRDLLAHPLLASLARALGRSPAEVLLRWSAQHGFVPLVKAASPAHQRQNIGVACEPPPFSLSAEQMRTLDLLGQGADAKRFAWDPRGYA